MLQSSTLIGIMSCLLMEEAIQICVPILRERIRIWSWIQRFEVTSLANMLKDLRYACSQWIKVPLRFRTLSWIWICILMLMVRRTLILILIRLNSIDIGLNIRCLA
jgi:hypothetical protein